MKIPLNTSLLDRRLSLLSCLFACGFGMGLIGCETLQQPDQASETEQVEQTPPPELPPCPDLGIRELEKQAIELLDRGDSETARHQLECSLKLNPDSYRARVLIEQLDADPVEYLGKRNYPYTVQGSDTLSKIAQNRLGSSLKFVILARYNDIEVPANLVAGQTITIPEQGGAQTEQELQPAPEKELQVDTPPPPPPPPTPASTSKGSAASAARDQALEKEESGDLDTAFELINKARDADASMDAIEDDYSRIKHALIAELEDEAYDLELSGSPQQAVETWRKVLQIDPGNIPAQLSINRLTR